MNTSARIWLIVITGLSLISIGVSYQQNKDRLDDIQESRITYLETECLDINQRNGNSLRSIKKLEKAEKLSPGGAEATRILINEVLPPRQNCREYAEITVEAPPPAPDALRKRNR